MQRSIDVRPPAVPGRGSGTVPTHPTPQPPIPTEPMPRRQQKKRHGLATLVAAGLVVILAATIGGLYVFGPGQGSGDVKVEVEAPVAVTSGDEVTYVVTVSNSDAALDVADLTLEYPVGFLVSSANPPADNSAGQSLFRLARLEAGSQATVAITGRLLGSVGTAAEVRARLDYEPVNFSSSFHVEGAAVTRIAASRIRLTFDAPAKAVSPGVLALSIGVENVADLTMNGVEVVLEVPEGVTVTSSTPPLGSSVGELRYDLGTLDPGDSWQARVGAEIVGDGGSRRGLAVAAYQRIGGQRVIVDRALREVEVVQPAAALDLYVNYDFPAASATTTPGSYVPISIDPRNTGQQKLEGLSVKLRLLGPVDWGRFQPGRGQVSAEAGTWQADLGELDVGAQTSAMFDLPIAPDAPAGSVVVLVATLGSATYGEDWQVGSGTVMIAVQ